MTFSFHLLYFSSLVDTHARCRQLYTGQCEAHTVVHAISGLCSDDHLCLCACTSGKQNNSFFGLGVEKESELIEKYGT